MIKRALGTLASVAFVASLGIAASAETMPAKPADEGSMSGSSMSAKPMMDATPMMEATPMMKATPAAGMSMHKDPMVGGAAMYPEKNIVENAVNSKDHTTLVAAVKAAGLVSTLESAGPFTVFAPTNAAFDALPAGTVPTLLKPENKPKLTAVLTYHVVAGSYDSAALVSKIKAGHGKAMLTTVQGETLTLTEPKPGMIDVVDSKKDVAHVTIADVYQKNGVIHVINKVLLP